MVSRQSHLTITIVHSAFCAKNVGRSEYCEVHYCVNSLGKKSLFPSQYTFICAGLLLQKSIRSFPANRNILTADYRDRGRLKAAKAIKKGLRALSRKASLSVGRLDPCK